MTIERTVFHLPDGELSVLTAGPQGTQTVLFLHGIPANALLFREVLPKMALAGYRVLAPDMPGYGHTRLTDGADYSLSATADRYARWLEAEQMTPVWLVGHDLGSAVAQLMATRHPQLLSHLTLSNAPIGNSFPVFAVKLIRMLAKAHLMPFLGRMGLLEDPYTTNEVRRGFGDRAKLSDEMLQTVFWDSKVRDPRGIEEFQKHLKHLRNTENIAIVPQLAQIPVPTLVLWSALDRFQPPETSGQRLLKALPEGTAYQEIPNAGHFAPLEAPAEYTEKLLQWKAEIDG